eukprot:GHVU01096669.1.p2 GENE.GHVU01096669.1~~GHVU01096669.1.p2  ORF type:complete len:112 (+),score=7.22 GHVU01096669.1:799-1134(+)
MQLLPGTPTAGGGQSTALPPSLTPSLPLSLGAFKSRARLHSNAPNLRTAAVDNDVRSLLFIYLLTYLLICLLSSSSVVHRIQPTQIHNKIDTNVAAVRSHASSIVEHGREC